MIILMNIILLQKNLQYYYYKFVDNNFTGFFWGNKMDFTYLKINHGSHFFRDRFGSFFGGKSRKSGKSRKRIGKKSKKKR